jgi:ribosomal protein S18 acetylase RimI-like enzyme
LIEKALAGSDMPRAGQSCWLVHNICVGWHLIGPNKVTITLSRWEEVEMRIEADRMAIVISRATLAEAPVVAGILTEAAKWLEGQSKWNDWSIPYSLDAVRRGIGLGRIFLARAAESGAAVGTLALQWEDERYWGKRPSDAGYVHRMAVAPEFMGRRIGEALLSWCAAEVIDRKRRYLRLDCPLANHELRSYYERLGFREVGEYRGDAEYEAALYEKVLDSR